MTIAIASSFTATPIAQALAFWLAKLDLAAHVAFAPYNQPFQQLLDPASLLSTNTRGLNIILIRLEDWDPRRTLHEPGKTEASDWRADLERTVSEFRTALIAASERSATPYVLVSCPPSVRSNEDQETRDVLARMEDALAAGLAQVPGVDLVRGAELVRACGAFAYNDPQNDTLAHIPYTPLLFTVLASVVARRLYGLGHAGYKALVVDCDDVLWTGRCGEDGPDGVGIDASRQAIQDFIVRLHDRGILICLCSRNNQDDVRAVFQQRPDMRLASAHIVASAFTWGPKSDSIRTLALELRLAPDTFVFLTADPVDCAEVQANCPQALTIQLPARVDSIPAFLHNLWIFQESRTTDEGMRRTSFYRDEAARIRAAEDAPTLGAFLQSLDLNVQVENLTHDHLARASELTHRTNQFNATTIRRSAADLAVLARQAATCLVVSVRDRFGDYGLVGLLVARTTGDALSVDTFLLSCRAMGRGVEHQMIAALGQIAAQQGLEIVEVPFAASGRNQPVLDFLRDVAPGCGESSGNGALFRIPTSNAAKARYRPDSLVAQSRERQASWQSAPAQEPSGQPGEPPLPGSVVNTRAEAALLVSIATDLSDVNHVHALVTARTKTRPDLENPLVAPRTPMERRIAEILADVLQIDRVGAEDHFFELGGDSLEAMQVLSRLRRAFQVELSASLLYSGGFTAASLAERVEHAQRAGGTSHVASIRGIANAPRDEDVRER